MESNTINLCRLCFDEGNINIFDENGQSMQIAELIKQHMQCEVCEYDTMPRRVCSDCWNQVRSFHQFYEFVKSSQNVFLSEKSEPFTEVEEPSFMNETQHELMPSPVVDERNIETSKLGEFSDMEYQETRDTIIKTEHGIEIESQIVDTHEQTEENLIQTTTQGKNKDVEFIAQNSCHCKHNCAQKIDVVRQKEYFDDFYGLQKWSQRTLFLRSLGEKQPVKENIGSIMKSKKTFISKYHLVDGAGAKQRVCSLFIEKLLKVSRGRLFRALKSLELNPEAVERRGSFPKKKTGDDAINLVKQFIAKFPTFESHRNKKYLHPQLNCKKLYNLYCDFCKSKNEVALKNGNFIKIFKENFNLCFVRRVKECDLCTKPGTHKQLSDESKKELHRKKKSHMKTVEKLKECFVDSVNKASENESGIEVFTFALQRAQEIPISPRTEVLSYRPLWCFNVCIFDEVRNKGYMYVWNESIALNGSQEIGSCLRKHLRNNLPANTKDVILYSNSHFGQTRNIKISLMIKHLFENFLKPSGVRSIEQRFFINGHSYNSCDRCFDNIEKAKKKTKTILVPDQWCDVISKAKKIEPSYVVVQMKREDFFSSEQLEKLLANSKVSSNGKKISWSKFQSITYDYATDPFRLVVKKYHTKKSQPISILLQKRNKSDTFPKNDLKCLYDERRTISQEKYNDLMALMQYLPKNKECQQFYESLEYTSENAIKDCALAHRQSSDDEDYDLDEKSET
ncbi:uncharacterized protein LOC116347732 [Contarinia nasturtii]|uniref:uncharacterized protein LOC116347732 n=1 Tax=Contarinia nasturtii TaxID=265458 RepID=UPI0012D48D0D|nr:uncharacterized protein LOC116347732 [Contarinia nasturtii]